jgi:hypothetical protein
MSYQTTTISQDFAVVAWPIGVKQISSIAQSFSLRQNYPNPFNPATKIRFSIPSGSFVYLAVYNALGREIKVLVNKDLNAGEYEAEFDGSNLASGIYYYRLQAGSTASGKMILLK